MVAARKETCGPMEPNLRPKHEHMQLQPLTFDKDEKNRLKKRKGLQQMVLGKLDAHGRRMKLDPYLSPYTKAKSNGPKTLI